MRGKREQSGFDSIKHTLGSILGNALIRSDFKILLMFLRCKELCGSNWEAVQILEPVNRVLMFLCFPQETVDLKDPR